MTHKKMIKLLQKLIDLREEILRTDRELHGDQLILEQPEIEPEETAQKDVVSHVLSHIDDQEKKVLDRIEKALQRIEDGSYGICEVCGRPIEVERLEAIPWITLCSSDEKKEENPNRDASSEAETALKGELPPDYEGLSDEDIAENIYDTFRVDDRVEIDELQVTYNNGVVRLRGFLPSEAKRYILLQILHDTLGFRDVVDELLIDPLLWQRPDRTPGKEIPPETLEKILKVVIEKPDGDTTVIADTPTTPSDEFIPDEEDRTS